jgi:hypothetical protein
MAVIQEAPGTTLSDLLKEGMAVLQSIELEDDLHHLTGHDRA